MLYILLRNVFEIKANKINVPYELYPGFGAPQKDSYPYIKIKFPFIYLIVCEFGKEVYIKRFYSIDKLLYNLFEIITFDMALQYEIDHRKNDEDCRKLIFSYQLLLMRKLSHNWEEKLRKTLNTSNK